MQGGCRQNVTARVDPPKLFCPGLEPCDRRLRRFLPGVAARLAFTVGLQNQDLIPGVERRSTPGPPERVKSKECLSGDLRP
jgi:hypothetical protein